jgi:superfamily II DNA or RNA helicase
VQLRDYQIEAVDFLLPRRRGFIIAPAGSGKTVIGAHAVASRIGPGQKVSWIANTRDQVDQAIAAISGTNGPRDVEFDVSCAAGQPDVSCSHITVVDECHHLPAETWFAVAARAGGIVWGLSATPWSDPDRDATLEKFFEGIQNFHTIERDRVLASGHLAKGRVFMHDLDGDGEFDEQINALVKVEVERRCRTMRFVPKFEHERRAKWQITQAFIQQNRVRNAHAVCTATTAIANGRSVLTLVGSIAHGEEIVAAVPGSVLAHSKMGIKARRATMAAFRSGELKHMVATSLADEGLDCPVASELILLAGGRSAAKIEQRSGRVMRPHGDKEFGTVHDYIDRGAAFAMAQAKAREKTYRKLGYEILRVEGPKHF